MLAAVMIDALGGTATLSKDALESFESKVLSIKWAVPDGVANVDAATELIFSYEALTQDEAAARVPEVSIPSEEISVS